MIRLWQVTLGGREAGFQCAASTRTPTPIDTISTTGGRFPRMNASYWSGASPWNSGNSLVVLLMNPDFVDLLRTLSAADAHFMVS